MSCTHLDGVLKRLISELKREICVAKFSGKTPNAIRQDFWAGMVLLNAVAVYQNAANEEVSSRQQGKNPKYLNRARTLVKIYTILEPITSA